MFIVNENNWVLYQKLLRSNPRGRRSLPHKCQLEVVDDAIDYRNAGQVVKSCSRFHTGWRILQNKKSKQGGMIISSFLNDLKKGIPVFQQEGKSTFQHRGKIP